MLKELHNYILNMIFFSSLENATAFGLSSICYENVKNNHLCEVQVRIQTKPVLFRGHIPLYSLH